MGCCFQAHAHRDRRPGTSAMIRATPVVVQQLFRDEVLDCALAWL